MTFSILVASYNNAHFLKECFDSVLVQTYQDFEVIVVDDASPDNSVELISEYVNSDDRFKLYKNAKNKGCGFTKNRCAELATGELCGFLDPDDALMPNAIERMATAFLESPTKVLISSKFYFTDLNLNINGKGLHGQQVPENTSYLVFGKGAITHFTVFKRQAYNSAGGIDPKFKRAVDQDLYLKLEEQGEIGFLDEFLYKYRRNKNSISANGNKDKARYWKIIALEDAYNRRKGLSDNIQLSKIYELKRNLYLTKIRDSSLSKKYISKYYFLCKLFVSDIRFGIVIKSSIFKIRALIEPNFPYN